jgi:histidinol-phosphate aminotransferase
MPHSRRTFLTALGLGPTPLVHPALVGARGREAALAGTGGGFAGGGLGSAPTDPSAIHIDSNENPLGPGPAAMEALVRAFPDAGRYPTNARPATADLREAISRRLSVRPENVSLGSGSWEILRTAVRLYTSSARALVTAAPTFEQPESMAGQLGVPVKRVPVDKDGRLDLEKMAQAARWAGLVYLCNPNNPTGTVLGSKAVAEFVARIRRESPDTAILVDEAYHDYVTDPAYATALPLALENPNVVVARTLSKAYGMAGLRVGYAVAQTRTVEAFSRWAITFNQNSLTVAAAIAALGDAAHIEAERARNTAVRLYTTGVFRDLGFRVMPSETNFVFVDIGRPAREFQQACAQKNVRVGREFPPLEKTCARVSLGTLDEMKRAAEVFTSVLAPGRASGASGAANGAAGK